MTYSIVQFESPVYLLILNFRGYVKMKTLFLIGFMGSGKSTIGKKLSKYLKLSYVDTDHYIEEKEKKSIKSIFSEAGEAYFRDLETEALQSIQASIVSTGGGIVGRKENIKIMKERGIVIYLDVPFSEIDSRLRKDATRPLWNASKAENKQRYESRLSLYEDAADIVVQSVGKTIDVVVTEIAAAVDAKNQV